MNQDLISNILNIGFIIIIIIFGIIALLSVYILNKYGRTKSITFFSSIVFVGLFILLSLSAFTTLQVIF